MCISWHHLRVEKQHFGCSKCLFAPLLSAKARSPGCLPFLFPRVFFTWFSFLWICFVLLHRNLSRWFLQFCLSSSYSRVIFLASPMTQRTDGNLSSLYWTFSGVAPNRKPPVLPVPSPTRPSLCRSHYFFPCPQLCAGSCYLFSWKVWLCEPFTLPLSSSLKPFLFSLSMSARALPQPPLYNL